MRKTHKKVIQAERTTFKFCMNKLARNHTLEQELISEQIQPSE